MKEEEKLKEEESEKEREGENEEGIVVGEIFPSWFNCGMISVVNRIVIDPIFLKEIENLNQVQNFNLNFLLNKFNLSYNSMFGYFFLIIFLTYFAWYLYLLYFNLYLILFCMNLINLLLKLFNILSFNELTN